MEIKGTRAVRWSETVHVMFVEWKIETVVTFIFIRPASNTYQEQQPYAHDMVKL